MHNDRSRILHSMISKSLNDEDGYVIFYYDTHLRNMFGGSRLATAYPFPL